MIAVLFCTSLQSDGLPPRGKHYKSAMPFGVHVDAQLTDARIRYRDMFETIKEPLLQTIDQHQGTPRTAIPHLQPDLRDVLRSMDQTEFSTMLRDMAGEPRHAGAAPHHQRTSSVSANDTTPFDMMPRLAFDFSLPSEPSNSATYHGSFDPATGQWYQNQGGTGDSWMPELGYSYSMSM